MSIPDFPAVSKPADRNTYNIIQFLLACLTALVLFASGLILLVIGINKSFLDSLPILSANPTFILGVMLVFSALLFIPFLIHKISLPRMEPSSLEIHHHPIWRILRSITIFLAWIGVLLLGKMINWNVGERSLITPFALILAIAFPFLFYLAVIGSQIRVLRPSRAWGSFLVGAVTGPLFSGMIEILLMLVILILIILFQANNPGYLSSLQLLMIRLSSAESNPEVLNHLAGNFLQNPALRGLFYLFFAALVPAIEEIFKQAPIWLLSWRRISPQEGFMIGALSGMGFAFAESLMNAIAIGNYEQFLLEMILRSAAGLIHITAGAVCGWGLATAFDKGDYLKAVFAYLAALTIHGLWNALATWESTNRIVHGIMNPTWHYYYTNGYPALLLFVFFIIMFCFWLINRKILKG